jgi:hypothetical protein
MAIFSIEKNTRLATFVHVHIAESLREKNVRSEFTVKSFFVYNKGSNSVLSICVATFRWGQQCRQKKQSDPITGLDRPLAFQEVEAPRISRQSAHEGGKVVSPTHWPPLPTGNIPGTHFC